MKYQYIILLLAFSIASCKNQKAKVEETDITAEVMAVHDEVMPKIGNINKASRALKKLMDEADNTVDQKKILFCLKDLNEAEEGMMEWMEEWSVPETEPEKSIYLKKEMIRIQKVKNDINSSLKLSSEILENLNK